MSYPGTSCILIDGTFSELPMVPSLQQAVKEIFHLHHMSPIQRESLPFLLEGHDAIVCAKTGSGKTLAFLLPIVHQLLQAEGPSAWSPVKGTAAIILSPTRELADQTYDQLHKLTELCAAQLSIAIIRGGTERKREKRHLEEGVAIVVATPGRLLDHMARVQDFRWHHLSHLVLDEADQLLEQGFQKEILQIVRRLPTERQTLLVSATLNHETEVLAKSVLKAQHKYFRVNETLPGRTETVGDSSTLPVTNEDASATVATLRQFYFVCTPYLKFRLLFTFLKKFAGKRIIVFMATCFEVAFFYEILRGFQIPVKAIHGRMEQTKRKKNHEKFVEQRKGCRVLLCTDVAARGLHFSNVDWVVQFDAPRDAKQYIHRVGRTARAGESGSALLLLQPHEKIGFLEELTKANVRLEELKLTEALDVVQPVMEVALAGDKELHKMALASLKAYVQSYSFYQLPCFRAKKLDLDALARMHGLKQTPANISKGLRWKKK